jgi:NAD(P)-dependent dehydrogenase (short-subunit alcohol dehydrogenase family)
LAVTAIVNGKEEDGNDAVIDQRQQKTHFANSQCRNIQGSAAVLASDEASYVNGQAIPVDGGLTASMPYAGKSV